MFSETGFHSRGGRPVHAKKEIRGKIKGKDLRIRDLGSLLPGFVHGESCAPDALLRRDSEEKSLRRPAVSVKRFPEQRPQMELGVPSETEKIGRNLLPSHCPLWGNGNDAQIIPPSQHGMSALEPLKNRHEPAGHQPWGDQTLRIDLHRGAVETSLPRLPAPQAQEQCPQDCTHGVLEIGNQLDGQ